LFPCCSLLVADMDLPTSFAGGQYTQRRPRVQANDNHHQQHASGWSGGRGRSGARGRGHARHHNHNHQYTHHSRQHTPDDGAKRQRCDGDAAHGSGLYHSSWLDDPWAALLAPPSSAPSPSAASSRSAEGLYHPSWLDDPWAALLVPLHSLAHLAPTLLAESAPPPPQEPPQPLLEQTRSEAPQETETEAGTQAASGIGGEQQRMTGSKRGHALLSMLPPVCNSSALPSS
jgi:hypothetical protein